ncbi:MAG TPA: hypothetical protein DIW31_08580 [Bacteroidales bacterium]|nr:hypothetical protein [Bacteroidales bacterium]
MAKVRRKSDTCLNCRFSLRPEDNYCPNCGQENNTNKIPVRHLIFEVLEDFFHFDAKIWNTIKASFSKPGRITIDYLEGRRARYIPPVKFYVFVSFIFFLLLGKLSDHAIETDRKSIISMSESDDITLNELQGNNKVYYSRDSNDIRKIEFRYTSKDSLKKELKKLAVSPDSILKKILEEEDIDTSIVTRKRLRDALALIPDNIPALDSVKPSYNVYGNVEFSNKEEYEQFKHDIHNYNDRQVDSILISKKENASWFNKQMVRKMSKYDFKNKDDIKEITHAIIKSISFTMFIMMPLTAILLLLLFYRKKYYYEHLIFSIHIHTIFFIIFSVILTIQIFISEKFGGKLWGWAILACLIYLISSLKNNYSQSWGKTIAKFLLMSIPYFLISFTLTILAIVYGFLA